MTMASPPTDHEELAAAFTHPGVADAYRHRPPYPAEVFDILERLIADRPAAVLDGGAPAAAVRTCAGSSRPRRRPTWAARTPW
jgi:hypothetical protein